MRIVGGTLSGRKISPPLSLETRPMMDRIRESLFNILSHREWGAVGDLFSGDACTLDAFCGTGALAFETISRGAGKAFLFDLSSQALRVAKQNAEALGIPSKCTMMLADATNPPPAQTACNLVFLAPPYRKELIPPAFAALDATGWIAPNAVIVAETAKKEAFSDLPGCELVVARNYGDTALHFLLKAPFKE